MTSIKNISKGGLFFFSHVNYPVGTTLELLVAFPFRRGKERAKVISKVVNVRKKGKFYGIGGQFLIMEIVDYSRTWRIFGANTSA